MATAALLASSMTVLLGLIYLTRGIFKAAMDLRDNKNATVQNTKALKELSEHFDIRITKVETWIAAHDRKRRM